MVLFKFIPLDQRLLFDASVAAVVADAAHAAASAPVDATTSPVPAAVQDTSNSTSHDPLPGSRPTTPVAAATAAPTGDANTAASDTSSVHVLVVASNIPNVQDFIAAAAKDTVVVTYQQESLLFQTSAGRFLLLLTDGWPVL